MVRRIVILMACTSVLLACELQAGVVNSKWVGGEQGEWGNKDNWDPRVVPDNNPFNTFAVTIDSNSIGVDHVDVRLLQDQTVNQLDCYGEVELLNGTSDWIELSLMNPNGLRNYGELEIEGECRMAIKGNVTNTTGAELGLWGAILIDDGDLHNSTGATIKVGGVDVGVGNGDVENEGAIVIKPESEFWIDQTLYNTGRIHIYGGQCEPQVLDNNGTGIIWGFGYIEVDELLRNKGEIYASGGSLAVICEGSVTNAGTLANGPLASLHIKPAEDVVNNGIIEVNSGGGVALDCNLVNEPNSATKLLGGTLSAPTITQLADATFEGFGGITSNMTIDPNGIIKLTGPTNIVGGVEVAEGATLETSDGTTLITGQTTCNGTIHMKGGRIIPQGGLSGNCNIIWEPGTYSDIADFNLDGQVNFQDFACFADTWLWSRM